MYRNFFSLSDLPFSISPDPKYLFMSDRHKEALAHLTYGLGETGGFALLTGEVGTGKTTISRCLMEQLPDNTQAAFILNPTLSSKVLLATLCDELKIRYRKSDASLKILTDKIAEKLLKNHENDINTLLIIDEAQHLQPEVLEQLRLLTNLETNTKKLLQVILIGQPELQQLLQRRDLRQLAQRITARYHLMPLTKQELSQYIAHRLSIASCPRTLFNQSAINKIHQLSGGIPRLINLLCHSSLMIAYNQNDSLVNKKVVLKAAGHALGNEPASSNYLSSTQHGNQFILKTTVVLSVIAIVSVMSMTAFLWGKNESATVLPVALVTGQESTLHVPQAENKPLVTANTEQDASSIELVEGKLEDQSQTIITQEQKVDEQLVITSEKSSMQEPVINKQVVVSQHEVIELKVEEKVTHESIDTLEQADIKTALPTENLEQVSDELLALFQTAVDETAEIENSDKTVDNNTFTPTSSNNKEGIKSLTQMPVWVQNGISNLTFEQHIYSSDGEGWVNVNGRDRYEGDMITADLQVSKILPQQVILSYRGETFSLPALTNW